MVKVILALLTLMGCGPNVPYYVDSDALEDLTENFRTLMADRGIGDEDFGRLLSIQYGEMPDEDVYGLCYIAAPLGPRAGFVNRVVLRTKLSPLLLRLTVYHELTHCVFLMDHIDDRVHIMNTYLPEYEAERSWDSLIDSLVDSIRNREAVKYE